MGIFDFFSKKPEPSPEVQALVKVMSTVAFPRGEKQIEEETGQLHALLRGRLRKDETRELLVRTKKLLVIAQDKSESRITKSILANTEGKLTAHEAKLMFMFLTGLAGDVYSGGDGSSRDEAVVINATSSIIGVKAEYEWIEARYGTQDQDWKVKTRMHGGKEQSYEIFIIDLRDGAEIVIHFDISSFYGRS